MKLIYVKFAIRKAIARPVQYMRYLYYRARGFDFHRTVIMDEPQFDRLYPKGYISKAHGVVTGVTIRVMNHEVLGTP